MLVTLLSTHGKTKTRVEIDYDKTLVLSNKDVILYGLKEGEEVSEETWNELTASLKKEVIRKCGSLLKDCSYSAAGLKQKLIRSGFPGEIAEYAVDKMTEARYVDDQMMAESYVRSHLKDKSRTRIRYDLMNKGISAVVIDNVFSYLEEEYGDSIAEEEIEQIRKLMVKRKYDKENASREETAKMWNYLCGKGYSGEAISRALS